MAEPPGRSNKGRYRTRAGRAAPPFTRKQMLKHILKKFIFAFFAARLAKHSRKAFRKPKKQKGLFGFLKKLSD
jgi:hypothetical protein